MEITSSIELFFSSVFFHVQQHVAWGGQHRRDHQTCQDCAFLKKEKKKKEKPFVKIL